MTGIMTFTKGFNTVILFIQKIKTRLKFLTNFIRRRKCKGMF